MDFITNIDNSTLTKSESRIWRYISRNLFDSVNMTISELADICLVSEATLTRFVKKIGFKSFNEFRLRLIEFHYSNQTAAHPDLQAELDDTDSQSNSIESEARRLYHDINGGLTQAIQSLNYQHIDTVSKIIKTKKTTMIVGFSSSGIVAEEFFYRLVRIGIECVHVKDSHTLAFLSSQLTVEDHVIIVSHSGRIKEQVATSQLLREKGIHVTTITSNLLSPLAIESNINLIYTSNDRKLDNYDIPPFVTIIQLYIVDLISILVSRIDSKEASTSNSEIMKFLNNISF